MSWQASVCIMSVATATMINTWQIVANVKHQQKMRELHRELHRIEKRGQR